MNKDLEQEIEDRKSAQEALQKIQKGFRLLMEYIPDILLLNDINGRIIDANQIACKALGYTREELLKLSIGDIEEKIAEHHEKLKRTIRGVPVTFEGMQRRKDGTTFPVEVRLWTFESGKEELMLSLVSDISEQKQQDEERKKQTAQLIYSQKIQSIGTLAGGIAHNFNNILMGIQGNVSLMMFDKKPEDPDYKRLNNIQQLIDNGARLTNQLIGYAREGAYYIKTGNMNRIVRDTLHVFFENRNDISIHLDLSENLSEIRIDKGQIEQVLLDIYINSADAMPEGGEIFIKTKNVTHRNIQGEKYKPAPGEYVMLSIEDTGTGMSREVMSRIFEPFFTTKGFAKKTGLGLAAVYGIIKAHGGYIEVESEIGKGSTFNIYLPFLVDLKDEKEKTPERLIMGKETILLVDDDQMMLETGEEILARLGYIAMCASGGSEAIKLLMEFKDRIDVVLLDMVMPGISGGEVYDRIKEINPDIKVILVSGYSQSGEADEILKRGCNGFIQKPFKTNELSKKLREILDAGSPSSH